MSRPRVMMWAMSPHEPTPERTTSDEIANYVVRVIEVGAVAEFKVNVAAVVLPSSFLTVSVVVATEDSFSICWISSSACVNVGAAPSAA